jgi:molybdopterin-guanine dinucleotide biosynthesis protein A
MRLNALILCGGKSSRMKEDKSMIHYHGVAQKEYLSQLVRPFCDKVFFSYKDQQSGNDIINDTFAINGPTSGIMSAFTFDPDCGWLVLACDLPYIDSSTIEKIIIQRDLDKDATAYKSEYNMFVEPLCTIYEPRIVQNFKKYIALNKTCPRKVLINSDVKILELENKKALDNANTQEDKNIAINFLKGTHNAG